MKKIKGMISFDHEDRKEESATKRMSVSSAFSPERGSLGGMWLGRALQYTGLGSIAYALSDIATIVKFVSQVIS